MNTKILLVDDEERILQTFARTLMLGGYAVITAASGSEGLALYYQEQPDIVLLDLRMPGMDGLEVLQAIREDDPEANVILCTAHGDKDAVIEALRAGASDFLPKPIDQVALESALRRAEERIHLKRELRASRETLRRHNEQLEEEVKARTAALEREIEERKGVQEELRQSEQRRRQAQQLARMGHWDWDVETNTLHWSLEVFDIFGQDREGFTPTAERFEALIHPEDRDAFLAQRAQMLVEHDYASVEHRIVLPDGTVRHVQELAEVLRDGAGNVIRVSGTVQDITDRKQAEEALRESHLDQVQDLSWLSQTALHLLSLADASEILDYAARALQEKLGDCFVWPLIRTSDGQALRLGNLPGMDDSLLGKAIELIGFDPRSRVFDVIPEFREIYQQGQLFRHKGGLAEFAASEVPRPLGEALAKLLGIYEIYTIGLVGRERVLGNLHIVARHPERIEDPELVESFAHQVALALEQVTANERLEESEERYRAVSELTSDFAYAVRMAPDGTYTAEWRTKSLDFFTGYSRDEMRDRGGWETLIHPNDASGAQQHFQNLLSGEMDTAEFRIVTPDGATRWLRSHAQPIWDGAEGRVVRIIGAAQDITGRRGAQEELRRSEERFRTLVNVLPQFVAYTGKDLNYRFVNRTYQEKFGVTPEDLIGRSVPDVIGETAFEEARPHIERVLQGEQVRYHECLDYAIGGTRDIDGILVPDVAEDGQVRGYYAILTDITPYMEVQAALHQTTERLCIQHDIDSAILAAQSPEEIARATLKHLQGLVPCERASISEIDHRRRQGRDLIILREEGLEADPGPWRHLSDVGSLGDTIQRGEVHHVRDVAALESPAPLERRLEASGIRSYVSVPLLVQDTPQGTLNLASETPGFFQPDHIEILEEIADSLAIALHQARLLEQTREDAETKALLLREVNHRVLNNLTMILGILDMEKSRPLENEDDFHAALDDVIRRVDGMVTVHRMLSSVQWAPLDLREVAVKVIQAALKGLPVHQTVEFTVEASGPSHRVTPREGIAVALIINELTTNSVKYAFDERSPGRITVRIVTADEEDEERKVALIFRDNGPGFPEAVLDGEREGIGLWLAESKATHDLGGEIELWNDDGAVVSLTFTPAAGSDRPDDR